MADHDHVGARPARDGDVASVASSRVQEGEHVVVDHNRSADSRLRQLQVRGPLDGQIDTGQEQHGRGGTVEGGGIDAVVGGGGGGQVEPRRLSPGRGGR